MMKNVPIPSLRHVLTTALLSCLVLTPAVSGQTQAPIFIKSFNPATIGPGSTSTLRFEVSTIFAIKSVAFTDALPAGMTIADPANPTSTCPGAVDAPSGGTTISFSGGEVASSCLITVDVTSSTPGTHINTTSLLTWETLGGSPGSSGAASANLTVATDRPGFTKSFAPSTVFFGGRSTLTFIIDNSLNAAGAANLAFVDNLPDDMVVAGPANTSNTCQASIFTGGVLTAVPGTGVISLSVNGINQAAVNASSSCAITVDVVANSTGDLGNTTGELTSTPLTGGGTRSSGKAAATLTGSAQKIAGEKSFIDDPVAPGGTVTLKFTLRNLDRVGVATDISFTDDLDAVVSGLEAIGLPISACGGSLAGTDVLTFTGGTLAPEAICTFSATLQLPAAGAAGTFSNTTSAISADVDGIPEVGDPASDLLFVAPIPLLTKTFIGDPVGAGGAIDLEFSITNTSPGSTATDIAFIDDLTAFLPFPITGVIPGSACGGSLSLISLGTERQALSLTGGTLAGGASCDFTVTLDLSEGLASGTYTNVTGEITATIDGGPVTGNPATDSFDLVSAPSLVKEFTDDPVAAPGTVTLDFTLTHEETAPGDATDVSFTDNLTSVLPGLAATGLPLADVCGAGSELGGTATNLSFTGGNLAPGESCTFSVSLDVPAAAPGSYANTTSAVVATVLGVPATGNAAADNLKVAGLTLTKEFTDDPVLAGDTVNLRFTLDNVSTSSDATAIFFRDDLGDVLDGLKVTPVGLVVNDLCGLGSSLTASAGDTLLTFQGGILAAGDPPCTFDVTLQVPDDAAAAAYVNRTEDFRATIDGTPNVLFDNATDQLTVVTEVILLTKEFIDDPVGPGDPVTLRFTLTNLNPKATIDDVAFSDDLEAALSGLVATSLPIAACGGTASTPDAGSTISFTGGSLAPAATCAFDVTLVVPETAPIGTAAINVTSKVNGMIGTQQVSGEPATDQLLVDFNTFSKAFSGDAVAGGVVTLTFTLGNLDPNDIDTQLAFSDNLDAVIPGLEPVGLPMFGICGEESVLEVAEVDGDTVVLFSGGTLLPGGSCTFSLDLQIPGTASPGDYVNVTSDLLQGGARAAAPAVATVTVLGQVDSDGDGVVDGEDFCSDTVIPESVPTTGTLRPNRYALMNDDWIFDTTTPNGGGQGNVFTTSDTGGCSCEQIVAELGLGQGHLKYGCSVGVMREWVALVQGGGLTELPIVAESAAGKLVDRP